MLMKRSNGERIFGVFNILLLSFLSIITLYPFLNVVFASLSDPQQLMGAGSLLLKPAGFSLEGYRHVLSNKWIGIGYLNSFMYLFFGTILNVTITGLLAYGLSRKLALNKIILRMIVFTMVFNAGLIPTFLVVKNLGLYGSRMAVILPTLVNTWNLMVMLSNFRQFPTSLLESAKIDGASEFTALVRIVMPLSKAIIAVMCLFYGVAHWNSWFQAMIYLGQDRYKYPLQLFLREVLVSLNTDNMNYDLGNQVGAIDELVKYSTVVVSALPILLIYPFVQRYFVKGVMIGSLKG